MNLLILGGTRFLGRYLTESALARGHQVTLFTRGRTNPGLFPQAEELHGDRDGNLQPLEGHSWDAVIDTCGYLPRVVAQSANLLRDAVRLYCFISSISVYAHPDQPLLKEDSGLAKMPEGVQSEDINQYYGELKVLCEREVQKVFPQGALIIRPGLIVGPHDPSDRFTYWPWRIALGGEVLAPGSPAKTVQFIDVRDLAEWNIRLVEKSLTGVFNATGPEQPIPMGDLLEECQRVSSNGADLVWVDEVFLLENGAQPWMELPLWLPGSEQQGMMNASIEKAQRLGLSFRPLTATIRDTLEWTRTRPEPYTWRAGMDRVKEAELLVKWKKMVMR
jgi:2'-hydroxyisoflavone reductase